MKWVLLSLLTAAGGSIPPHLPKPPQISSRLRSPVFPVPQPTPCCLSAAFLVGISEGSLQNCWAWDCPLSPGIAAAPHHAARLCLPRAGLRTSFYGLSLVGCVARAQSSPPAPLSLQPWACCHHVLPHLRAPKQHPQISAGAEWSPQSLLLALVGRTS